jgi:uncharacterized surface protein with fasciclin (FAS1) repeats
MRAFVVSTLVLLLAAAAPAHAANNWAQVAAEGFATEFYQMFQSMMAGGDEPAAPTVADLAQHAPSNMSILINAVDRADLQTVIANPDFTATIFCPTNKAFRLALLKLKITPAQLYADKTTLTNILSYHVIDGKALAISDLKDGQELTTVSKQKITAKVDKVAGTSIQGGEESAQVLAGDVKAGKSIIHIVDAVLLPPKPSVEAL